MGGAVSFRLLWVGLLLTTLAALFATVERSGAVPASEFAPAVPLYASILWLRIAGAIALAAAVVVIPDLLKRTLAGIGAAGVVAGFFVPMLTGPSGALLLAILTAKWFRRDGGGEPDLRRLPWRGLLLVFVLAAELGTLAAYLLARIESATYTLRFVPWLVPVEDFALYRGSLPVLALVLGVEVGMAATLATVGLALLMRVCRGARKRARIMTALTGAMLAGALVLAVYATLGDEITAIGTGDEILLLAGLLAAAIAALLEVRTVASPAALQSSTLIAWLHQAPVLLLTPSRRLLGGRRCSWRAALGAALVGGILLVLLGLALYPTVEDFRMKLFASYSRVVLYLFTLILLGLTCPVAGRRAGRAALLAGPILFGAALIAGRTDSLRPETRLIAHEYSRFGALAANSWIHRWTDPFPVLGMQAPEGTPAGFPHHRPGEARFSRSPDARNPRRRPPIIVVIWDAARPDRMSTYGYSRDTTPQADRLAHDAVVFEEAVSLASATTTSVRQLLSGQYVSRYMLSVEHPPFLVRELVEAGYDRFVVTVTGNDHNGVSAESFRRGWDPGRAQPRFIDLDFPNETGSLADGPKVRDVIATWRRLDAERGLEGSFSYVHLTGSHSPWPNENPVRDYGTQVGDRYDGELAKVDNLLGRLLDALEELEAYEDCILVLLADHGTALGEHGRLAGFLCYEEQMRIPLLIKAPGMKPRRVADRVASIDLTPTLLDLVAPEAPFRFDGRSLVPLLSGEIERLPPRPMVAFCAFWDSYAIYDPEGRWKLHHHRRRRYEALYDLAHDPRERKNLIGEHPLVADELRRLLGTFLWEGRSSYGNPFHYRAWVGPKN